MRTSSLLGLLAVAAATLADGASPSGAPACPMTPVGSFWHADVSALPVHPQSAGWVASIGASAGLKADFGSGTWNGGPIGIPYTTCPVRSRGCRCRSRMTTKATPARTPSPNAPIEGGAASSGDRHVLVVDRDAGRLWELYAAYRRTGAPRGPRARARPGASTRTRCARSAGRPATPRGCRSSRASCAGTG